MPGINQLPAGAEAVAGFVLAYSSVSWVCSILLIWCARQYHEAWSYISLLAYFALISNTASIIQQAHDITYYRDILAGQFYRKTNFLENPELAISNGSYGLDLALYYIQYYSYNVLSMLVMFWAFELAQSVYGLSAKLHLKPMLRRINSLGKFFAVFFPLLTILLLRVSAIQNVFIAFILLADLPLMVSLAISSIMMIVILVRYIQSRKRIINWTPQENGTTATNVTNETSAETIQTNGSEETEKSRKSRKSYGKHGMYDRWLMVRFTVAFVILAIFEATNTLFQLQAVTNNTKDSTLTAPDYSLSRAKTTLFLFLPGVTPGIFLFLVFGTTAGCRTALKDAFMLKTRSGSGTSSRWSLGRPWRKSSSGDPEQALPISPTTLPEVESKEGRSTSPVKVAVLVSKYNTTFDANHERSTQSPSTHYQSQARKWSGRFSDIGETSTDVINALEPHDLAAPQQTYDDYYQAGPEQSDDSGPILPIMAPEHRRTSRGQLGFDMRGAGGNYRPSAGQ